MRAEAPMARFVETVDGRQVNLDRVLVAQWQEGDQVRVGLDDTDGSEFRVSGGMRDKATRNQPVLPAQPGWDVLWADHEGVLADPVIGWVVTHAEFAEGRSCLPITGRDGLVDRQLGHVDFPDKPDRNFSTPFAGLMAASSVPSTGLSTTASRSCGSTVARSARPDRPRIGGAHRSFPWARLGPWYAVACCGPRQAPASLARRCRISGSQSRDGIDYFEEMWYLVAPACCDGGTSQEQKAHSERPSQQAGASDARSLQIPTKTNPQTHRPLLHPLAWKLHLSAPPRIADRLHRSENIVANTC